MNIHLEPAHLRYLTDKELDLHSFYILERLYDGKLAEVEGLIKFGLAKQVLDHLGYTSEGQITDSGTGVVEFIRKKNPRKVVTPGFVDQFRDIFPARRLPTGKNFRSNLVDLEKKLKLFFKSYDYDPETVLEAARQYVLHAEQKRYEFIRTAAYFVYKNQEGSELADWCEKVSELTSAPPSNQTFL